VTQQRQFPRYALEAAVTLTFGDRSIQGRTANMSRGGLCAMVDETVAAGTRVAIEIALVFENDTLSESLTLSGRVVWCTAYEKRHQVGLSFAPVRGDESRSLDLFLRFLQKQE
jgi:hypothetical protein